MLNKTKQNKNRKEEANIVKDEKAQEKGSIAQKNKILDWLLFFSGHLLYDQGSLQLSAVLLSGENLISMRDQLLFERGKVHYA